MRKTLIISLTLFAFAVIFATPTITNAADPSWCSGPNEPVQNCCDESKKGTDGLVPCGRITTDNNYRCQGTNPNTGETRSWLIQAASRVQAEAQCRNGPPGFQVVFVNISASGPFSFLSCRCELYHVFFLILNVYKFALWILGLPLAGLLFVIGGILLIAGGAYSKLRDMGKRMLWGAAWGLGLLLGSWLIINIVLMAIGYQGAWFIF